MIAGEGVVGLSVQLIVVFVVGGGGGAYTQALVRVLTGAGGGWGGWTGRGGGKYSRG